MKYDYTYELEQAMGVAIGAGRIVMEVYRSRFEVRYKQDETPVTQADRRADAYIRERLQACFPDYGMLSEEHSEHQDPRDKSLCFVVDPVDGTKEFVKRSGQFGVNIALSHDGEPVMGVIYIPATRQIYFAARRAGSFRGRVDQAERIQQVHSNRVSRRVSDLIVTMSHPYKGKHLQSLLAAHEHLIGGYRYIGSSIKGCMVASGEADVYYRFGPTSEWDTAAMHCIVEEAGGVVRQMDGTPLRYNREDHLNRKGFYIVNRPENIWTGLGDKP